MIICPLKGYCRCPSWRQKIRTDIDDLNSTINQLYVVDIYRICHQTTALYTLVSSEHGVFNKIDHTLSHKTNLNKTEGIETIQSTLSDDNEMAIGNKKRAGKSTNHWSLNNILLSNIWLKKGSSGEMLKIF